MKTPDQLPRLATGTHDEGSGKACIMNAISYLEGDAEVTDLPECVFGPLAAMAQMVNDKICDHGGLAAAYGEDICGPCSHKLWKLGARLIGTARVPVGRFGRLLSGLNFRHVTTPQIFEWSQQDASWRDVSDETLASPEWRPKHRNRAAWHALTALEVSAADALSYAATAHMLNDGTLDEAHRIVDTFEELAGERFGRDITDADVALVQRHAKVSVL